MKALRGIFSREIALLRMQILDAVLPLAFYLLVVLMFAFGTRANDPTLAGLAVSILWVGALLSALLPLPRLFASEFEDGTLEQWCLAGTPLVLIVALKLFAHWCLNGLPLAVMALPLAVMLGLESAGLGYLALGLMMGTAILTLLGGLSASLLVGIPRAGSVLPLLVLPLMVPVVIFGSGAVRAWQVGGDPAAPLYFGFTFRPCRHCAAVGLRVGFAQRLRLSLPRFEKID